MALVDTSGLGPNGEPVTTTTQQVTPSTSHSENRAYVDPEARAKARAWFDKIDAEEAASKSGAPVIQPTAEDVAADVASQERSQKVIDMYRQILAGYDFRPEKVTGDKASRAAGLAAQMEAGAVDIVSAVWTTPLEDELLSFPAGAHDDQVDACSGAFRALSLTVRPRASYLF